MATVNPHTNQTLKISNLTGSVIAVGGGMKVAGGASITYSPPNVQVMEETLARLDKLVAAGKVSYKFTPGENDIAGIPTVLRCGITGAMTTASAVTFAMPNYVKGAAASPTLVFVMTEAATLRNMMAVLGTAPGGTDTVIITVQTGATIAALADTAITCTITGTAVTGSDLNNTVNVNVGDIVSLKVVSTAATAANLSIALESA